MSVEPVLNKPTFRAFYRVDLKEIDRAVKLTVSNILCLPTKLVISVSTAGLDLSTPTTLSESVYNYLQHI